MCTYRLRGIDVHLLLSLSTDVCVDGDKVLKSDRQGSLDRCTDSTFTGQEGEPSLQKKLHRREDRGLFLVSLHFALPGPKNSWKEEGKTEDVCCERER